MSAASPSGPSAPPSRAMPASRVSPVKPAPATTTRSTKCSRVPRARSAGHTRRNDPRQAVNGPRPHAYDQSHTLRIHRPLSDEQIHRESIRPTIGDIGDHDMSAARTIRHVRKHVQQQVRGRHRRALRRPIQDAKQEWALKTQLASPGANQKECQRSRYLPTQPSPKSSLHA